MSDDVGELVEIRRELREVRWFVDDDDLRERVNEWIDESHEQSDADTAEQYVESQLNRMLARNEMYHAPHLPRGADGFPDACEGCRHYGAACPVVRDDTEKRWRERKLADADTEQEARRVFQKQAVDVSCHRIPEFLDEWDNQHADFVRTGQMLLSAADEHLRAKENATGDELDDGPDAVADGGGSA
jgi:hypothetical protein